MCRVCDVSVRLSVCLCLVIRAQVVGSMPAGCWEVCVTCCCLRVGVRMCACCLLCLASLVRAANMRACASLCAHHIDGCLFTSLP